MLQVFLQVLLQILPQLLSRWSHFCFFVDTAIDTIQEFIKT